MRPLDRDESRSPKLDEEAESVFRESKDLIREALTRHYRVEEREALSLEADLRDWFHRFCRRAGAPPPRDSRHTLLLMACVFGRGYQRYAIETGVRAFDERLDRVLRRDPAEVAREVTRTLKLLYRRLHRG